MALSFEFVSAFVCERALIDQEGVLSAIRMVDIFQVPENIVQQTVITFYAVFSLRTMPVPDQDVKVAVYFARASGDRDRLPNPPPDEPYKLRRFLADPSIPGGVLIVIQVNIQPRNAGVCFVELEVDDVVLARIPVTILHIPVAPAS